MSSDGVDGGVDGGESKATAMRQPLMLRSRTAPEGVAHATPLPTEPVTGIAGAALRTRSAPSTSRLRPKHGIRDLFKFQFRWAFRRGGVSSGGDAEGGAAEGVIGTRPASQKFLGIFFARGHSP